MSTDEEVEFNEYQSEAANQTKGKKETVLTKSLVINASQLHQGRNNKKAYSSADRDSDLDYKEERLLEVETQKDKINEAGKKHKFRIKLKCILDYPPAQTNERAQTQAMISRNAKNNKVKKGELLRMTH